MHDEQGGSDRDDDEGYFLVSRKLRHHEIFLNPPLLQMLLFCIDAAAFVPRRVPMRDGSKMVYVNLKVGQFVTGRNSGARELGIHPSTFRDRLEKLQTTGTITIEPDSHWSVITVCNYEAYQKPKKPCRQGSTTGVPDRSTTGRRQAADTVNELNNQLLKKDSPSESQGAGEGAKPKHPRLMIPPPLEMVAAYCLERRNGVDAQEFIDHYEANGWKRGRTKIVDWQAAVRTWEANRKEGGSHARTSERPGAVSGAGQASRIRSGPESRGEAKITRISADPADSPEASPDAAR